jgi:hypothetical protein
MLWMTAGFFDFIALWFVHVCHTGEKHGRKAQVSHIPSDLPSKSCPVPVVTSRTLFLRANWTVALISDLVVALTAMTGLMRRVHGRTARSPAVWLMGGQAT